MQRAFHAARPALVLSWAIRPRHLSSAGASHHASIHDRCRDPGRAQQPSTPVRRAVRVHSCAQRSATLRHRYHRQFRTHGSGARDTLRCYLRVCGQRISTLGPSRNRRRNCPSVGETKTCNHSPCVPNADKQRIPDLLVHVVPDPVRHLQGNGNRKPDLVIRVQSSARGVTALNPYRQ